MVSVQQAFAEPACVATELLEVKVLDKRVGSRGSSPNVCVEPCSHRGRHYYKDAYACARRASCSGRIVVPQLWEQIKPRASPGQSAPGPPTPPRPGVHKSSDPGC